MRECSVEVYSRLLVQHKRARSPNSVRSLGRQYFVVFSDRRPDRVAVAATVLTRSVMYFGA